MSPAGCDNAGTTTFTFTATGLATGPYPGTFEAHGTYTIGPAPLWEISTDVQYEESFTIRSGETTITGTEEVASGDTASYFPGASGICTSFFNGFGQHGVNVVGSGLMRYHATFEDSTGTSTSSGLSGTTTHDERYDSPGPIPDSSFFTERFNTADADLEPPSLSLPGDISVPATSPGGASVAFTATATDDRDAAPTVTCAPPSGTLFPIGDTTVTCAATDASGNSTTGGFNVHVSGASEQTASLIELVLATNARQGIVNGLNAKLNAVKQALGAANGDHRSDVSNDLAAFVNDVDAQVGKALTAAEGSQLIAAAQRIRAVLGS